MDIKDRLIAFLNVAGITKTAFAKSINVTQGNVSDWVNRKKPSKPSPPAMARINEVYGLNLNWLITGKGEMFIPGSDGKLSQDGKTKDLEELSGNGSVFQYKINPFESRIVTFPIYGEIAAGEPLKNHNKDSMKYIEIPKAYLSDQEKTYCALRVIGNSMSPRISDGDIVVIHESADILNLNGKICACQTPDGITLKKLQLDEEKKRVLLRPLNQEYDVIVLEEYELETFRILGEMALLFRVV